MTGPVFQLHLRVKLLNNPLTYTFPLRPSHFPEPSEFLTFQVFEVSMLSS